jgi:hypothetical protein
LVHLTPFGSRESRHSALRPDPQNGTVSEGPLADTPPFAIAVANLACSGIVSGAESHWPRNVRMTDIFEVGLGLPTSMRRIHVRHVSTSSILESIEIFVAR